MKSLYEQTILPEPFSILGRTLRPFSFGHFIVLRRFRVGYVSDFTEKLTVEDLIFSVYFCSHSWKECKDLIYSGKWQNEVTQWGLSLQGQEIDMEVPASLFNEYLAYHTVRPKLKPAPGTANHTPIERNSEWYENIISDLIDYRHYTNDEIMDLCYSQAMYEYSAYLEKTGRAILLSDKNEQGLEYLKSLRKQKEQNG